jgi:hypothetical protein
MHALHAPDVVPDGVSSLPLPSGCLLLAPRTLVSSNPSQLSLVHCPRQIKKKRRFWVERKATPDRDRNKKFIIRGI